MALECMEISLASYQRTNDQLAYDAAVMFGNISNALREKIEKGDYTERDAWRERVDKLFPQQTS